MPRRICIDLYDDRDGYWYADQNQFVNRYNVGNSGMNQFDYRNMNQPYNQLSSGMNQPYNASNISAQNRNMNQPNNQTSSGLNQTSNRTNTGTNQ